MKRTTIIGTAMTASSPSARPPVSLPPADRGTFDSTRGGLWPCFVVMDGAQAAIRSYLL
jgi:hypothetical protein